jgi:hypothetical protein
LRQHAENRFIDEPRGIEARGDDAELHLAHIQKGVGPVTPGNDDEAK